MDLEQVVLEDVWQLLQSVVPTFNLPCPTFRGADLTSLSLRYRTRHDGLTDAEAEERLGIFGHNRLEAKPENAFLQFL